jgi:hypothetical protein
VPPDSAKARTHPFGNGHEHFNIKRTARQAPTRNRQRAAAAAGAGL